MPYEDIYNPDTSKYKGDFSSSLSTSPPLSISPTDAYYGGYMDKGDLQSSTSTLREVSSTLRNVLSQFTGAISTTFNTLRNMTSQQNATSQQARLPGIGQSIVQPYVSPEAGRYVGSATFLESARGALTGRPGSPYLLNSDYQQLMSENFAKRSTIFGGSVASVAAEMGGGWLGAKALGPMIGKGMLGKIAGGIGGYMGVGYLASHAMGRVNQGLEFDSLLQDTSSRMGINEGGAGSRGFSSSTRRKMAKEFRGESRKYGGLGMGDYADIMEYGTEYGLFQGVADPQQFTETVKNAAKQLKTLMKVMREPDVRGAIKDMATFKQWGVPQGQMISFAMHADAVGRATGMTTQGVLGHMAGGVQMARQMGMSGQAGASLALTGSLLGKAALRSGAVGVEEMARYDGEAGYGQQAAWELQQQAGGVNGRMLLAALSKTVGEGKGQKLVLDEDAEKKWMSGKLSVQEIQGMAGAKLRDKKNYQLRDLFYNNPHKLREKVMSDESQWFKNLYKTAESYERELIARGHSPEEARIIATNQLAGSSEAGERMRASMDSVPEMEEVQRSTKSEERAKEAKEAAKGRQGLSGKWKSLTDTAYKYTLGGFNKAVDENIVDPLVGVKNRIDEKVTDFRDHTWYGMNYSTMPGAVSEGVSSPGQLTSEAEGRVKGFISSTGERAGKAKTKEIKASVWADKIKDEVGDFGGGKLADAGAYENLGSYMVAQEAVLGGKGRDGLKGLSGKYKLNPDDTKKAEELYDSLKELLKQKKITEESLIEHNKKLQGAYKELKGTGAGQSGETWSTQRADYPKDADSGNNRTPSPVRESLIRPNKNKVFDEWSGKLVTPDELEELSNKRSRNEFRGLHTNQPTAFGEKPNLEYNPDVSKINEDTSLEVKDAGKSVSNRLKSYFSDLKSGAEVVWDAVSPGTKGAEKAVGDEEMPAPVGGYIFDYPPGQEFNFDVDTDVTKINEDTSLEVGDPKATVSDKYGELKSGFVKALVPNRLNTDDFGVEHGKDRSVPVDRKKRFKKGMRKADHGKERFRNERFRLAKEDTPRIGLEAFLGAKSDTLSQHTDFDAWMSKWGGVDLDDIQASPEPVTGGKKARNMFEPIAYGESPLGPGYTGPRSKDYQKEAMVQVGTGDAEISVPVSMAKYYKQGKDATSPIKHAPDVSTQGAGDDTSSSEAAVASKALGSSQGGLAQNAEKTSKSLEKVNKGLGTFATKLESIFLRATKSSNHY